VKAGSIDHEPAGKETHTEEKKLLEENEPGPSDMKISNRKRKKGPVDMPAKTGTKSIQRDESVNR